MARGGVCPNVVRAGANPLHPTLPNETGFTRPLADASPHGCPDQWIRRRGFPER